MKMPSLADFYKLLNLVDDYFRDGFRREHPDLSIDQENPELFLERIAREVSVCRNCNLHLKRTNTVPGEGTNRPAVLIIGEGPGAEEDKAGRPFVGKAGQYLNKWLQAIDLNREDDCFITNIVKCRPPGNRDPKPEETSACLPYLEKQIETLAPGTILTLGRIAAQILTGLSRGIGGLRSAVHTYRDIPLVATYHPSAVLRNPPLRAAVWEDLKLLSSVLDRG